MHVLYSVDNLTIDQNDTSHDDNLFVKTFAKHSTNYKIILQMKE